MQHIQKAPPLPDELSPLVPLRLSRLMHQMLAKNPANRPSLTSVRAAALATLLPNSKLASALAPVSPRAPAVSPRMTSEAAKRTESGGLALWAIGGAFAVTLLMAWGLARSPDAVPLPPPPARPAEVVVAALKTDPLPAPVELVAPVTPTPTLARVELTVFPANAEVRFNEQRVATSSGVAILYGAPDRSHSLSVTSPGFTPRTEQLRLTASERRTLTVSLEIEPIPAVQRPKATGRPKGKAGKEIIDPF